MNPPNLSPIQKTQLLATQAGLSLSTERAAVASAILEEWHAAANALSERMSAAQHQDLVPVVCFAHAHIALESKG